MDDKMNKNTPAPIHPTGQVIWITGLPGSGKTTLAVELVKSLRKHLANVVHLDGDSLRQVLSNHDYSIEGRKALALQYSGLAKLLAEQGQIVIVSTVSLFHDVHDWNRAHFPRYVEVWLQPSQDSLMQRDQKGLYTRNSSSDVVGRGIAPEFPRQPTHQFAHDTPADTQHAIHTLIATHFSDVAHLLTLEETQRA
jgi:adenylylsulfate kinase